MKVLVGVIIGATLISSCVRVRLNIPGNAFQFSSHTIEAKGNVLSKDFNFNSDYDRLVVSASAEVVFVQDDSCYAEVQAAEDALERLEIVVEDRSLVIRYNDNVNIRNSHLHVVLHSPAVSDITVNGACDLKADRYAVENDLRFVLRGAADINIDNLQAGDVNLTINGAADIEFDKVQADDFNVSIMGAGDIVASDLACTGNLSVDISGSGSVSLDGYCEDADFTIKGSGDIDIRDMNVKGNIVKTIKGGGSIKQ